MTEYGRSSGSEPWHPEDPLYGDGGWGGQQAQVGQQAPYGGQPQHYPEQPQQPQYGGWGNGQQAHDGQGQQQYPYYDGQGHPQYPDQQQQQYQGGGWDTGAQQHAQGQYPAGQGDPYQGGSYGGQSAAYGGGQHDYYGTPDAYPQQQGLHPEPELEPQSVRRTEPEPPQTDWDPGPDQGEHAFFAGGNDDDDDDSDDPDGRGGRGDRKGKGGKGGKKGRSGVACLVVVLVLGGGIGGVGYFGYQWYQNRFAAAPDYVGDGTSETVSVTIPNGAFGSAIGQELKKAGVVKSVDAFVTAQANNPKGDTIQAGVYTLKKQMSAASAVALMLDPKSKNGLTIFEGQRNKDVYAAIDKRLGLKKGATQEVADKEWSALGLPDWANDNKEIKDPLEGFLYPSTYSVSKGMKPKDVLKEMVGLSKEKYNTLDLEGKAKDLNLKSPLQVLTVASLVQAEGKTNDDFRKMAEVVYNRLKPTNTETNQLLQFDSTFNYLKGESNIDISESEINSNQDPYNTYTRKGLPPGPICNPGDEALKATLNPTHDGWIYFVAVDGVNKTQFARTHDEFLKLKEEFNASSGS